MRFTLRDTHLIDATTDIARGDITIDGAHIEAIDCEGHSTGEQETTSMQQACS